VLAVAAGEQPAGHDKGAAAGRYQASSHRSPQGEGPPMSAGRMLCGGAFRRWTLLWRVLLYPFALVTLGFVILALPIVGNFVFLNLSAYLTEGCDKTVEGIPVDCLRWGLDFGYLSGLYAVGLFIGGVLNPYLAFKILNSLIPWFVWVPWVFALGYVRHKLTSLKKLQQPS